ncbi:hypothetical protein DXG01_016249 [Tephrocybe rancida]|nr:hypothetical protein DXG01_016249 [Tephrocybe rancida]
MRLPKPVGTDKGGNEPIAANKTASEAPQAPRKTAQPTPHKKVAQDTPPDEDEGFTSSRCWGRNPPLPPVQAPPRTKTPPPPHAHATPRTEALLPPAQATPRTETPPPPMQGPPVRTETPTHPPTQVWAVVVAGKYKEYCKQELQEKWEDPMERAQLLEPMVKWYQE